MFPLSGNTIPKSDLIKVVFPDPFGPNTAVILPGTTSKSIPRQTLIIPTGADRDTYSSTTMPIRVFQLTALTTKLRGYPSVGPSSRTKRYDGILW